MKQKELDARGEVVDRAIVLLMEHFDAVQILATVSDPHEGETYDWMRGGGNWYARQGLAQSFLSRDKAQDIGVEVANRLPPPDDGDKWKEN